MNFKTLRSMIESILKSFTCPMCQSAIGEWNVDIIWAAGTTVNIDIECPGCKKHALIKAEVAYADSMQKEKIEQIRDMLKNLPGVKWELTSISTPLNEEHTESINDSEIVKLSQSLKNKKISASDLFAGE